ncbi:TMEM41A [Branchiostoma lanceolatum]|uniref:TMEM41A protein n=1 Tax=Branchiostoma lanceolatum TaxID=7740 RepID=A0A8J9Z7K7_BRALA|nr:TMEM41A [Branchiostoma lanceolatum]
MRSVLGVAFIFAASSCFLYFLSTALPSLEHRPDDSELSDLHNTSSELKFPSNLEELRWLAELLQKYCQDHWDYVWLLFCSAYLYKQTWAIPGSVFLVEENLPSLFFLLLFLRLFPMTPNWFLNISSPIVGVPIWQFFFSVLIGLMPYNFVCVQTGGILSTIKSIDDVFSAKILMQMLGAAMVALLPGIFLKLYKPKLKTS